MGVRAFSRLSVAGPGSPDVRGLRFFRPSEFAGTATAGSSVSEKTSNRQLALITRPLCRISQMICEARNYASEECKLDEWRGPNLIRRHNDGIRGV